MSRVKWTPVADGILYFKNSADGYDEHNVFITEEDRKSGKVTIPASVIRNADKLQIWLIGENQYGRLKKRRDILVTDCGLLLSP